MRFKSWGVRCCIAAALFASTQAAAQGGTRAGREKASAAAAEDGEYARLIRSALVEVRAANWAEARALFLKAHALAPNARSMRGLAITSFELRRYVQAIREFREALLDRRTPLTDAQRAEAQDSINRAQAFVGEVKVVVEPSHAALLVDAEETTERALLLNLGQHELRARATGFHDRVLRIDVEGGQTKQVVLTLTPLPAAAASAGLPAGKPEPAATRTPAGDIDEDQGGLLSRWWFWTVVGVVVAGGVTTGLVLAGQGDDAPEYEQSDVGGLLEALGRRP